MTPPMARCGVRMVLVEPRNVWARATPEETSHEYQSFVQSPRTAGIDHRDTTGHHMAVIDNWHASCGDCDWSVERATPEETTP